MGKEIETSCTELAQPEKSFIADLKNIASEAQRQAYRNADLMLVVRNWLIGKRIVEQEQAGAARAEYGKRILALASKSLTEDCGKRFSPANLKNIRSFRLMLSTLQIGQALLDQFKHSKTKKHRPRRRPISSAGAMLLSDCPYKLTTVNH